MDSPKTTRTGTRTRRKIFSCPVCDEVFVDEESLRRHELTHQNADAPAAEEASGEPPPPPPSAEPVASAASTEPEPAAPPPAAEAAEGRPVRTLSSVRRQAQQQAQAAQVEAPNTFLETEQPSVMPVDPDATQAVVPAELGPMGWEPDAPQGGGGGLGKVWGAVEDFSEWVVRGSQNTLGFVGSSVVSGLQLAFRLLLVLALGASCLYLGTWFGRTYGPRLWGQPVETPVIPPTRTVGNNPKDAQQSVRQLMKDFYAAIDRSDYKAAYGCLSAEWRKELAYDSFARGYRDTRSARCEVKSLRSLPGGRYQIDIALEVVDSRGKPQRLQGSYVAIQGSAGWKLDQGSLR